VELASSKWSWTHPTAQSSTSPPTCVACCVLRRRRRRRRRCERDECSRGWPGLKPALTAANKWIPSHGWNCVVFVYLPANTCEPALPSRHSINTLRKRFHQTASRKLFFCFIKQSSKTCNRQHQQLASPNRPLLQFTDPKPPTTSIPKLPTISVPLSRSSRISLKQLSPRGILQAPTAPPL